MRRIGRMWGRRGPALCALAALALAPEGVGSQMPAQGSAQEADARALVARAVDLAGGESALRGVQRVSLDMMTQWQRTGFREVPFTDRPSFEPHHDVRDYSIPAWRNTRDFGARRLVNVVRDSVALSDPGDGLRPLSVAYVDEREELFTYTPDRLLLALLDAPDLAAAADTVIGGEAHRTVSATLRGRYPSRVYLHAGSGLPTMLAFRAGHPNDFGLVEWGEMDVQVWYSGWRTFGEIAIPTQWDVLRVGVPYKRMTVRRADFAPDFVPADSFAVSEEQRAAYWASLAPRPMHEGVTVQDTEMVEGRLAVIRPAFGVPGAAVDAGGGWVLVGAGQAPFNFDQGRELATGLGAGEITGVLVVETRATNGGVVRASELGLPIWVSPGAEPFVRRILRNHGASQATVEVVRGEHTLGRGEERLLLAPVDLPDAPGSLLVFKPSLGWLFVGDGLDALHVRMARERAGALGWAVERVGTPREYWPGG